MDRTLKSASRMHNVNNITRACSCATFCDGITYLTHNCLMQTFSDKIQNEMDKRA